MVDTPMGLVQSGRTTYTRVVAAVRVIDARAPWLLQAVTIVLAVVLYGGAVLRRGSVSFVMLSMVKGYSRTPRSDNTT